MGPVFSFFLLFLVGLGDWLGVIWPSLLFPLVTFTLFNFCTLAFDAFLLREGDIDREEFLLEEGLVMSSRCKAFGVDDTFFFVRPRPRLCSWSSKGGVVLLLTSRLTCANIETMFMPTDKGDTFCFFLLSAEFGSLCSSETFRFGGLPRFLELVSSASSVVGKMSSDVAGEPKKSVICLCVPAFLNGRPFLLLKVGDAKGVVIMPSVSSDFLSGLLLRLALLVATAVACDEDACSF
jgi:hypothetical protein